MKFLFTLLALVATFASLVAALPAPIPDAQEEAAVPLSRRSAADVDLPTFIAAVFDGLANVIAASGGAAANTIAATGGAIANGLGEPDSTNGVAVAANTSAVVGRSLGESVARTATADFVRRWMEANAQGEESK